MADDAIRSKFELDISQFKTSIADMNRGIRIAQNNFKAAAGSLGDWKQSQEGIEAKMKSLTDVMSLQRAKVEALSKEYDDLKSSGSASENSLKKLQEQISKAAAELSKTEGEFKDAEKAQEKFSQETNDAAAELQDFANKAEDAGQKTRSFGDKIKDLGSVLKTGISAGAKAVGASMLAVGSAAIAGITGVANFTQKALENADAIQKQADITGLTAEQVQELSYVAATAGVDFDTLASAQGKLTKSMAAAKGGTGPQAEALKKLGISATDSAGNLRSAQEVMTEAFGKLSGIGNETERDALAMQLFGKSAMELNPLIKLSSEEMARLTEEARKTGAVISNENVAAMDQAGDSIESLKQSAMGLGSSLVVAMLPAINETIGSLKDLAGGVMEAVKTGDWSKVGQMVSDILVNGIKKLSSALPGIIKTVTDVLKQLVNVVVTLLPTLLPLLMNAAMTLIQGVLDAIKANMKPLMDMAVTMLTSFVNFILMNLPLLLDVALQMIVALALGIAQALPTLIPTLVQTIMTIVDTLLANLGPLIAAAIQIILALVQGLIAALPKLIAWLPAIINSIIKAIIDNLPLLIDAAIKIIMALNTALLDNLPVLIQAAIELVGALIGGLVQAIPQLVVAAVKLIGSIVNTFINFDWLGVGKDIINGIADGIGKAGQALFDAAKTAAQGALDEIKKFLGIASPSKVMRDQIGKFIPAGIAQGIMENTGSVDDAMKSITSGMTASVAVDVAKPVGQKLAAETTAAGAGSGFALNITNFYNNTDKDMEALAYQFEFARQKAAAALGG